MSHHPGKIRVENQPDIVVGLYANTFASSDTPGISPRPFRVLFVKPYHPSRVTAYGPPLGIITLISELREAFGDLVKVDFLDMKLYQMAPGELTGKLEEFRPDIVGVSALNCEASASHKIAEIVKTWNSKCITMIGGPYTLRQSPLILSQSQFDWSFEGASDRSLREVLSRYFSNAMLGSDIPGFNYKSENGDIVTNNKQDLITDMDALPMPAWDMIDFDRYRKHDRQRMITNFGERKYAFLFTSRGCPYLCNYCHDIFTKRFVYRSVANVIEEIRILHEEYGIDEFHFVDDIFNLHKPRVQQIMAEITRRWPGKLRLAFPNGLRGDIFDEKTIQAMVDAGTYLAVISVETVTPRLQALAEKHLDIDKADWAINEFEKRGVIVQGSFMLGFPTETPEEIEATINYAIKSKLSQSFFFAVTPQPGTPIYDLAMQESSSATLERAKDERDEGDYNTVTPWYARAYGYDLNSKITMAFVRFYAHPFRMARVVRQFPVINLILGFRFVFTGIMASMIRSLASLRRKAAS